MQVTDNDRPLKPQYGWVVSIFLPITPKSARFTVNLGVTANQVSWLSLLVFMIGAVFYFLGRDELIYRLIASVFFTLGTFFDVLDGAVARLSQSASKYGALLDASIDLVRYNIFFICMFFLLDFNSTALLAFLLYVALLNYSFITYITSFFSTAGKRTAKTLGLYDEFLPESYKNFCLRNKLLFNPFNIEDQLLFMFFILGVIFKVEIYVLYMCLFFRLIDVALILRRGLTKNSKI